MKLKSKSFGHMESILHRFTCQGDDISPELYIEDVPSGATSLVLIMDDPDAPGETFDHWIMYDMPGDTAVIPEDTSPGTQGMNGFGNIGYGGPCPPSGTHRYVFKVYALPDLLNLPEGLGKDDVEKVMAGKVLDQAELVGLYGKS